jgi:hypothetical protein
VWYIGCGSPKVNKGPLWRWNFYGKLHVTTQFPPEKRSPAVTVKGSIVFVILIQYAKRAKQDSLFFLFLRSKTRPNIFLLFWQQIDNDHELYNSYAVKYLLSKFRTTCIKSFPQVEAENFVYSRTDGDR